MSRPRRPLASSLLGLLVATLLGAHPAPAAPAAVKTIRIKNAHTITVVMGKKREQAAAVRPDADGWKLVLAADLDGSSAELSDVTPKVQGSKWTLAVAGGAVTLDPRRFLPTHVYRVELRRDRQLLGSALIYLQAPPAPSRKSRVDFAEGTESEDRSGPIAPAPKGGL